MLTLNKLLICRAIDNKLITYCNLSTMSNLNFTIMKKINLKGISDILSEKELKNVMGGSGYGSKDCFMHCYDGTVISVSKCSDRTPCVSHGGVQNCNGVVGASCINS